MGGKDTELTCSLLTQFIMQTRYIERDSNAQIVVNGSDVHRKLKGECNWKLNCLVSVWLIIRPMIIEVIKATMCLRACVLKGSLSKPKIATERRFRFLSLCHTAAHPVGKGSDNFDAPIQSWTTENGQLWVELSFRSTKHSPVNVSTIRKFAVKLWLFAIPLIFVGCVPDWPEYHSAINRMTLFPTRHHTLS